MNVKVKENSKINAKRIGDINADEILKGFTKNDRIVGLTNGRFSLISLIHSVLKITNKADVLVSTWSAGVYDANEINRLINSDVIGDFKLILDRSFKTRQKNYSTTVMELFKEENIRTTNTHSKFVLIKNKNWNITILSSMNLNENKRCENFDISNDIKILNIFNNFANDLFEKMPAGIIESRKNVDPVFDELFSANENGVEVNFEW